MSQRIQAFLVVALTFSSASHAVADSTSRAFPVPASLGGAAACREGSSTKVHFKAVNGDDVACNYSKNGGTFDFKACDGDNSNILKNDIVIADSISTEPPTYKEQVPEIRLFWFPFFRLCYYYLFQRSGWGIFSRWGWIPFPYWVIEYRPYAYIVWVERSYPACFGSTAQLASSAQTHFNSNSKPACGLNVTTANVHQLGDLDCSSQTWAGFQFTAAGKTFDGRRHSIAAPRAAVGLFVMGDDITVNRASVSGVTRGFGMQGYNTNRLTVTASAFKKNFVGLNVYNDQINTSGVSIVGNDLSDNSDTGLKFSSDNGKRTANPVIRKNNVARSGNYGFWLDVDSVALNNEEDRNFFLSCKNGIMFVYGDASAKNFDFSKANLTGVTMFFNETRTATLSTVDFSYGAPATPTQERVAAHFYRVPVVSVFKLKVASGDVGVKLATDRGLNMDATIKNNILVNETTAGIMIQSYDGTPFGRIDVKNSDLRNNNGRGFWKVGPTVISPLSEFVNNLLL